jgi:hypothetical protein
MDTVVPTPANTASPYVWQDADGATPDMPTQAPTQAMDGGPQVSQPTETETPRAATVRRVATAAAGVGLVAAAVLTARGLRGANANAGANVIDYDD